MKRWATRLRVAGIGLLGAAVMAAGCGPVWIEPEHDPVYVEVEPPPPMSEVVPGPPGHGYTWVPGHWYWTGHEYVWVPGAWSRPPVVGHVWVPAGWVLFGGRYRYVPGRWAHPHRVPHYRYVQPSPRPVPNRPAPKVKQHMGVHPTSPAPKPAD